MTRLVIVRHGNTFEAGEPPRRIGARTDLPLTATGVVILYASLVIFLNLVADVIYGLLDPKIRYD